MTILDRVRVSLVAVLACAAAWAEGATHLQAGPIAQPTGLAAVLRLTEPFDLDTWALSVGTLNDKWQALARKLDDERVQIALCDGDREHCASPAALRLLTIVDQGRAREGRARLGEINRAINLAIRPVSDLAQHGEEDVWSSPLATFSRGAGDCEDYAIAKYVALRQAGLAARDLRIVILRDVLQREDHAVAAARLDGHWLLLDNRRMAMVEDSDAKFVHPLFVIDDRGVAKYAEAPVLLSTPEPLTDAVPGVVAAAD